MSIKAQRVNQANAIASGTISAQSVDEKFEKIAQKFAKSVSLSGFRKGKAPLSIIKQRYGTQIQQEVEQEAVREGFQEALKDLQLGEDQILGNPAITKFDRKGKEIDVEFKISIAPKIDLSALKSCVPEMKIKEVSLKQIDERCDEIAKHQAPLIEAKAGAKLAEGDTANIDFEGFLDGVAFEGGKAEGFDLLIGSNQFVKGFEEQLVGMKKDEQKEIQVTFPEEYQAKNLAGKQTTFKVKLNAIKQKGEVKLDDSLAQKVLNNAEATLQTLKDQIKLQLENEEKAKAYNQEYKPKFVETILEKIDFDLPDLIVEQEMNILLNNYARTLSAEELEAFQKDSQKIQEKRKELEDEARKSVKITFIVDSAAKEYGVQVQDNEVMQTLYYEAMMSGQNPKEMLEFYQKSNLLPAIKMAMLEDRILTMLLDEKYQASQANQEKQANQESKKASPAKSEKEAEKPQKTSKPKADSKTPAKAKKAKESK